MAKKTPTKKPKPIEKPKHSKKHKPAAPAPAEPPPYPVPDDTLPSPYPPYPRIETAPAETPSTAGDVPPAAPPEAHDDSAKPHLELPLYPGLPFPEEIDEGRITPVPVDLDKVTPLAAPLKHERVFLKPWTPWHGLSKHILMTLPDGVSLPDIPDEGVFADVTCTPPGSRPAEDD